MARTRRRTDPARPFVVALLILCALALLSFLRETGPVKSLGSSLSSLQTRDYTALEEDTEPCRNVHQHEDQCAFIRTNCVDEEAGLISYLNLYYCQLPNIKPLGFFIIAIWTALLFSTIGIAASDFFCINLSTISNILGMSESMAGVTFLAFGNGSPDVFSTFAAIKSNSGSLAVGELIGAAGFITAVVSGSMALIRPFKVAARSFVRDVLFFIVAVAFSMVFLANGKLTMIECAIMVGFYVFYVAFVCVWHWWLGRRRRRREREAAMRGHYTIPGYEELEAEEEYLDAYHDDEDEDRSSRRSHTQPITAHDMNQLERADFDGFDEYADLDDDETRDKWMGELSSNMRISKAPDGERKLPFTPIRPSLVGALEFRAVLASLQKSRNLQTYPINMRRYSDAPYYTSAQQQDAASTTTDPAGAQNAFDISIQDQIEFSDVGGGLADENRTSNRLRAVSANDAAGLRVDSDALRSARGLSNDLLDVSPPRPERPRSAQGALHGQDDTPSSQDIGTSPLVSISPALDDTLPDSLHLTVPARTGTQDFLAPPESTPNRRSHSVEGSREYGGPQAQPKPQRPILKVPIPHSSISPPHTPSHSPLLLGQSTRSSSRTASFMLPPPSTDVASIFPKYEPEKPVRWWPYKVLPAPQIVARTLFPTLYGWRKKSVWERLLGLVSAPSFFFLTITLPVVEKSQSDDEKSKKSSRDSRKTPNGSYSQAPTHPHSSTATAAAAMESRLIDDSTIAASPSQLPEDHISALTTSDEAWNRWLVVIQCFTGPLLIVFIVWANTEGTAGDLIRPILYSLLGSLIALLLLLLTTTPSRPPRWHFMLCFVGFAVAITWISTIANEVVGVLKTIGVIFGISDAILGLTIFAVGNSLGDLVADITVARLGYPVMALSACFGGPMLNILLGIGLSGLYMTVHHAEKHQRKHPDEGLKFKPYHVDVSTTLLISTATLMVTLVGLLIVVPLNGWRMDKRIGWGLIILWIISTVGNVVVEVTGLVKDFS